MMMTDDEWNGLVEAIEHEGEFMTASQDRTVRAIEVKVLLKVLRKELRSES